MEEEAHDPPERRQARRPDEVAVGLHGRAREEEPGERQQRCEVGNHGEEDYVALAAVEAPAAPARKVEHGVSVVFLYMYTCSVSAGLQHDEPGPSSPPMRVRGNSM